MILVMLDNIIKADFQIVGSNERKVIYISTRKQYLTQSVRSCRKRKCCMFNPETTKSAE